MRRDLGLAAILVASGCAAGEPGNRSTPIEQAGLPVRVHVFEDYETEIEKRWWLSGKPVTENVPPSLSASAPNSRCCRAGETKNYDDKMEDRAKVWKGVIFNPVPGPPMGPRTNLSFRYWIKGTDVLRVQLYSLTNNYHRYLTLTGVPQEKWQAATVDMTQMRRPDGSGGPLSADERIDDIQFYITPDAELLIDDIVLYERAPDGETRPFPKRIIFTGWFDTGKQGAEWPGTFEIVPHAKPLTWKAAKSVKREAKEEAWIRVQLRRMRPLSKANAVRFKYHLTGGDAIDVALVNSKSGARLEANLRGLTIDQWGEASVTLGASAEKPMADELHLVVRPGTVLMVDDVLIYEP